MDGRKVVGKVGGGGGTTKNLGAATGSADGVVTPPS
jgi:hypothetical protein